MAERLLTEDEAASRLSLCARTLREIRQRGEIKYVKVGVRGVRYKVSDVDQYIEANTVRAECQSTSRRTRRIGNTTSDSRVYAFTARQGKRQSDQRNG